MLPLNSSGVPELVFGGAMGYFFTEKAFKLEFSVKYMPRLNSNSLQVGGCKYFLWLHYSLTQFNYNKSLSFTIRLVNFLNLNLINLTNQKRITNYLY
jgi:hypothetical protein